MSISLDLVIDLVKSLDKISKMYIIILSTNILNIYRMEMHMLKAFCLNSQMLLNTLYYERYLICIDFDLQTTG